MGKFVIKTDKKGEFRFNLHADNGQVILSSEGYTSKAACENGIESVKKNAPEMGKFEKNNSSNGKYYFNLKAANGQIIGTSQMYASAQARDTGIASVKANGGSDTVKDLAG